MRHLVVNQNTTNIENTGNSLIEYVYNLVKNKTFDRDELSGNVSVQHAYADAMDYLMERYRNLHITATRGEYIRFIDPVVENYYINEHGDGVGLTLQQAQSISQIPSFESNTELVNFNDLKYFTSSKSILSNNFKETKSLTDIDLINVQDIGANAFQDSNIIRLNNHQYIKGPIGEYCFWNAYNVSGDLDFRNAISWIRCENYTFRNTNIQSIKLPTSITEIKTYAFAGCRNLKSITGVDNVTKIWDYAFDGCALEGVLTFPSCTSVYLRAFSTSVEFVNEPSASDTNPRHDQQGNKFKVTKLVFPELTNCGNNSFNLGSYLTEIDMPKLKTLGVSAFNGTGLTSISLPECTSVGDTSFGNCVSLRTVDLPLCTDIKSRGFQNCTSLESIDLTNITSLGAYAFQNCTSLTSLGPFNANLRVIAAQDAFSGCTGLITLNMTGIQEINNGNVFNGCTNLTTVTGMQGFLRFGHSSTFKNCKKLSTIDLSHVLRIGGYTFSGCTSLTTVDLSSCTFIDGYAFDGCSALTTVSNISCNLNSIRIFQNCTSLDSIDFIGVQEVNGEGVFLNCTGLITVLNSSNLLSIGENTFAGCSSLTSIDISNCTSLGDAVFNGCSSLETVTSGSSLTLVSIPHRLFKGCINLKFPNNTVTINSEYVGYEAFSSAGDLKTVYLGSTAKKLYPSAFNNCYNITQIQGLENITHIGSYVFAGCENLEGVIDLSNLQGLTTGSKYGNYFNSQEGLFYNCKKVTKIIIGTIPELLHNEYQITRMPLTNCSSLHTVDITSINRIYVGHNTFFYGSDNMQYLVLRCTTVPTLELSGRLQNNNPAFTWSRIMNNSNGKIYVPDSALNDYKTAANWSVIADHIFPLSEYVPIVD